MKIANIVLQILGNSDFIKIKGHTLREMNYFIMKQLED